MDTIISPNEKLIAILANLKRQRVIPENLSRAIAIPSPTGVESFKHKLFKCSEFNLHTRTSTGHIIYNTLYNSLVRLSASEYLQYKKNQCNDSLRIEFIKNGLWVEKSLMERKKYLELCKLLVKEGTFPLNLTVTSTLECNAHCPYCYEHGVSRAKMSSVNIEPIINFIKRYDTSQGIDLTWFGGEPLMNIPFMDSFSQRLRREKIKFTSYLITNGSLLTNDLIQSHKKKWNLKKVQISFDGTCERYERIKSFDDSKLSFQTIISAIHCLAKEGLNVHLRLNICYDNCDDILKLTSFLDNEFAAYENVVFYPSFITGEKRKMGERDRLRFIKELFKCVKDLRKLTFASRFHSLPRFCSCHAANPMSFTIDVNGNVFECEHNVGRSQKAIGHISSPEQLRDTRKNNINEIVFKKCETCVFLPKCLGGCRANLEINEVPCFIDSYIIRAYLTYL